MSSLFRPPVNRAMRALDRNFFRKTVPMSAARVFDPRNTSRVVKKCAADLLQKENSNVPKGLRTIVPDPNSESGGKVLLMRPGVKYDDLSTVGPKTVEFVENKIIQLLPYMLKLDYNAWDYSDIASAVLPEDLVDEAPVGFTQSGHIAHMNLRTQYLPYRFLLGQVILDKNPRIETVVNKVEDVGTDSVFRTFPMELLAGKPNTEVEVHEHNCRFAFDFADVYWNSRLEHEHGRLIELFEPGQVVADVMGGVGPFAIPAAKKGVLVWANDLNPECFKWLRHNVRINKVSPWVRAHNEDGRTFIRDSIRNLYKIHHSPASNPIVVPPQRTPREKRAKVKPGPLTINVPKVFSHFVMNLPASAVEFLDAFVGSYRGLPTDIPMPMIHVYSFHKGLEETAKTEITARIRKHLRYEIPERDIDLYNARDVGPRKFYCCASFMLPRDVAWSEQEVVDEASPEELKWRREEELWLKWLEHDAKN